MAMTGADAGREAGGAGQDIEPQRTGAADPPHGLLALIRLVIAASAAIVFAVDIGRATASAVGLGLALAYVVYSALIYILTERPSRAEAPTWLHWADVAWYTALIVPSGGLDSAMFPFFFFPILVASIRDGFGEGVRVAVASAALGVGTELLPLAWGGGHLPHVSSLMHALLLLLVGYLTAIWGSKEIEHRRRLTLLGTLTRLPNPRLGPQQVMGHCLEHIRVFHDAQSCVAVMRLPDAPSLLFLADDDPGRAPVLGQELDAGLASRLLDLPARVINWCGGTGQGGGPDAGGSVGAEDADKAAAVAELLEAPCYIGVPLTRHGQDMGRLFVTRRGRAFGDAEAAFLHDLADHVVPMIENIHVLDRIATDATLHEREKISRDLHDGTIQPYIGLKLGLEALRRRVPAGDPLGGELDDLIAMTAEGIAELRRYVGGLRERDLPRETSLVHAIWRVAEKYREFYGIDVAVNADPGLRLSDRLAAEVFQVVNEGLSNVRRHTASRTVTLNLRRQATEVVVQVVNDAAGPPATPFTPRSIVERVKHLGGRVDVAMRSDGGASVTAEIPL